MEPFIWNKTTKDAKPLPNYYLSGAVGRAGGGGVAGRMGGRAASAGSWAGGLGGGVAGRLALLRLSNNTTTQ